MTQEQIIDEIQKSIEKDIDREIAIFFNVDILNVPKEFKGILNMLNSDNYE